MNHDPDVAVIDDFLNNINWHDPRHAFLKQMVHGSWDRIKEKINGSGCNPERSRADPAPRS